MPLELLDTQLAAALVDYATRRPRDPQRMIAVQNWCVRQLAARGLKEARTEVALTGAYRTKNWDVALVAGDEVRLAISTKSIVRNLAGTVPNRLDDMLGEAANLHRLHPRAVIGYFLVMSEQEMSAGARDSATWFERCGKRIALAASRNSPAGPAEQWEGACALRAPLGATAAAAAERHVDLCSVSGFFDLLAARVSERF